MQPAYRTIADDIRRRIKSGALAPGDRVPSVRTLGEEHGVTQGTAALAYRALAAEGWLVVEQGRGTVVADTFPPDTPVPTLPALAAEVAELRTQLEEHLRGH